MGTAAARDRRRLTVRPYFYTAQPLTVNECRNRSLGTALFTCGKR